MARASSDRLLDHPTTFLAAALVAETDEFSPASRTRAFDRFFTRPQVNWAVVLIGMMMVTMTTVSFYLITAYTPTFGRQCCILPPTDSLVVTLCVGVSNLILAAGHGRVSDRIGRRPVLIRFTLADCCDRLSGACPGWCRRLLLRLLVVELVALVHLWQLQRRHGRVADRDHADRGAHFGLSLAYSLATAMFGGFTPAISTYLIHATDNRAVPGLWLSAAALLGLIGAYFARPQKAAAY